MALDKTCKNVYYLTGRFIAVMERSNNEPLSPTQFDNIFLHPSISLVRFDRNKQNYFEERQEIMEKMPAEGFPESLNPENASTVWIGYHHQRASMPRVTVEYHDPEKVSCCTNNDIRELRK